ncbi:hypothetical protein [Aureibacillus halotolerans]|uniref:Uncharacterized protein n=1 Tax=Aureibacillus halotolerans TaxID=1508390 RepID=A0A4R6U8N5_9BACI|nr:hypothetical protein [Aureibacillus halotolerans]TDQ42102.1 hypothetical protein EV213_102132 [Aureibacillus halotolerans]
MLPDVHVYHYTGNRIVIKNVPQACSDEQSFAILASLQKQIDDLERIMVPQSSYPFNSIESSRVVTA